jgi:hypothetical protein
VYATDGTGECGSSSQRKDFNHDTSTEAPPSVPIRLVLVVGDNNDDPAAGTGLVRGDRCNACRTLDRLSPTPVKLALGALGSNLSMSACLIESDGEWPVPHDWTDLDLLITDDKSLLDLDVIHGFLKASYGSEDIPQNLLQRAIDNSIAVGLYRAGKQVGFARVVTDRATFAYLADVFIWESLRERGLSKQLMRVVMAHPELRSLRRWHLVTRDLHAFTANSAFQN